MFAECTVPQCGQGQAVLSAEVGFPCLWRHATQIRELAACPSSLGMPPVPFSLCHCIKMQMKTKKGQDPVLLCPSSVCTLISQITGLRFRCWRLGAGFEGSIIGNICKKICILISSFWLWDQRLIWDQLIPTDLYSFNNYFLNKKQQNMAEMRT